MTIITLESSGYFFLKSNFAKEKSSRQSSVQPELTYGSWDLRDFVLSLTEFSFLLKVPIANCCILECHIWFYSLSRSLRHVFEVCSI